jgi:dipeptidase E
VKLYLSSYKLGDHVEELIKMAGPRPRVAVISNARDFVPVEARRDHLRNVFDPIAHFAIHGMVALDFDLRNYFGRPDALKEALKPYQIVWALGGNAFLLRRAMHESGFDSIIGDMLEVQDFVYAGWSAGAVVAAPDLRGIELMDDPDVLGVGYPPGEIIWAGLDLIDFAVVPHFESEHPESASASRAATYLTEQGIPFETLRDGDVIIKSGEETKILRSTA